MHSPSQEARTSHLGALVGVICRPKRGCVSHLEPMLGGGSGYAISRRSVESVGPSPWEARANGLFKDGVASSTDETGEPERVTKEREIRVVSG